MRQAETDFNLEPHLLALLSESAFHAELCRNIRKIPTTDMPTAMVTYNTLTGEFVLYWNPEWFAAMTAFEIRGVLLHELSHLYFMHLTARMKPLELMKMWNIATDLAINSLIMEGATHGSNAHAVRAGARPFPKGGLFPGQFPEMVGRELTEAEKAASRLGNLIASLPKLKSSEFYFDKLKELSDQMKKERQEGRDKAKSKPGQGDPGNGEGDPMFGDDWIDSIDDHSGWAEISEEERELIEAKAKDLIGKAAKEADKTAQGWGSIPSEIRESIRNFVSNRIDWRGVLRQFVGTLIRANRTTSMKRINRKYPYIHPGKKNAYMAKLLIAIDMSGSVDNGMLEEFFAELATLTKRVGVDILPFDCSCNDREIYPWKKGQKMAAKRTRSGGTDFNAPTSLANHARNRGKWDGLLILTDGEAPAPGPSRMKRGWVLGRGQKLMFDSRELKVSLDDCRVEVGSTIH